MGVGMHNCISPLIFFPAVFHSNHAATTFDLASRSFIVKKGMDLLKRRF
jgi:hypothetical protein